MAQADISLEHLSSGHVFLGQGLGLSELAPRVVQSEIRAMTVECDRMGGVNLAQGICDTEVPEVVAEGAIRAIRDGSNIYTRLDGIARLRAAIAAKVERMQGMVVDPEREVLVTNGASGAFHATAMALLNPGDEVLLFEPFYGYHVSTLTSMRIAPVAIALEAPDWSLNLDAVRAAITPKTRAMVINTPSNPAGKVFTRKELEGLTEIAQEFDLFCFTDEIYEHFVYGEAKHLGLATMPGMRERTIVMSGFSKTFSVTGWRVGYLIADARWLGSIAYFHDLTYICAPAPLQHGVADGVEQLGAEFYEGLAREHEGKRTMIVDALRAAGMTPHVPDGAYYILASAKNVQGATAAEKARALLAKTGVASVAGSAFFRPGKGEDLLRFCFAKKDADLTEACRRLRALGAAAE
jgi:aminotransferase